MASSLSYRAAVVGLVALGISAVIAVQIFRPGDNMAILASVFAFISSTLALLKVQETHSIVNSRMDEFKVALQRAAIISNDTARAEGVAAGREAGRTAANVRTDKLAADKDATP